ncbi:MAG: hypothetical protein ACLR62_02445 [Coprococcus sp.]
MAEQNTTDKLTLAKFEEAYDIVHKVVLPTKLIYSDYFSGITGNKVYFKPENLQKTGAYKIRGAYYKMTCNTTAYIMIICMYANVLISVHNHI